MIQDDLWISQRRGLVLAGAVTCLAFPWLRTADGCHVRAPATTAFPTDRLTPAPAFCRLPSVACGNRTLFAVLFWRALPLLLILPALAGVERCCADERCGGAGELPSHFPGGFITGMPR